VQDEKMEPELDAITKELQKLENQNLPRVLSSASDVDQDGR